MGREDEKRYAERGVYIDKLQEDIGALARTVKVQNAQLHAIRDEASDILHESDILLEVVGALKAANTILSAPVKAPKQRQAAPSKTPTKTGKRVRIRK